MKYQVLPIACVLFGCSSSSAPKTVALEGTVDSAYPGQPAAIRATDETGMLARAKLSSNGSFRLVLNKDHTYHLDVVGAGVDQVVFPRKSGALDRTFHVSGGGARVVLGQIRHFDALPTSGFRFLAQTTVSAPPATTGAEACVNGMMPSTGAVCADDSAHTTCEAEAEDDDGEVADDGAGAADGECVNGKDSVTGSACTDAKGTDAADPASPIAVPDHNVPDDVGGCDDGEAED